MCGPIIHSRIRQRTVLRRSGAAHRAPAERCCRSAQPRRCRCRTKGRRWIRPSLSPVVRRLHPATNRPRLVTFVTPGYFQTIGMRLVAGRLLTDRDSASFSAGRRCQRSDGAANLARRERHRQADHVAAEFLRDSDARSGRRCRRRPAGGLHDRTQPACSCRTARCPFGSMTIVVRTTADAASAAPVCSADDLVGQPARLVRRHPRRSTDLLRDYAAPRRFTFDAAVRLRVRRDRPQRRSASTARSAFRSPGARLGSAIRMRLVPECRRYGARDERRVDDRVAPVWRAVSRRRS